VRTQVGIVAELVDAADQPFCGNAADFRVTDLPDQRLRKAFRVDDAEGPLVETPGFSRQAVYGAGAARSAF